MGLISGHQLTTFASPVNATSPIDANTVRGNDNTVVASYNAHDADATIHLQTGTLAARPAAGSAGQSYLTTDTRRLYLDNGSVWNEIAYPPVSGPIVQTTVTWARMLVSDTTVVAGAGAGVTTPSGLVIQTAFAAGIFAAPTMDNTSSANGAAGMAAGVSFVAGAYTTANAASYIACNPLIGAGVTLTNNYGVFCQKITGGGTFNVAYYSGQDAGATSYHFYGNGLGKAYFGGPFGCNAAVPQAAAALGAASTDLASVITLANNIRTALIANGIGV